MDNSKFVCHSCIIDTYLSNEIKESGQVDKCSYCKEEKEGWPLNKLAERVDEVFKEHYVTAVHWEPGGEQPESIIESMINPDDYRIPEDIKNFLEEEELYRVQVDCETAYYDGSVGYEERPVDIYKYTEPFDSFKQSVKHKNRFYMHKYNELLTSLFSGIEEYKDRDNLKAIRDIAIEEKDKFIYRARKVENNSDIVTIYMSPHKELSAPPKERALAGRMNPAGISVFYASFSMDTCVSEIRLPVGGRAVVGKFEIICPLRILDLTVFDKYPAGKSEFDPEFDEYYSRLNFLKLFHQEIRKPVQPSHEDLEYLPTQAVTEFLKHKFNLDGIIFTSAQVSGKGKNNITLFNHASVVETPEGQMNIDNGNSSQYIGAYDSIRHPENIAFVIRRKEESKQEEVFEINSHTISSSLRYVENSIKLVEAKSISHKYDEKNIIFEEDNDLAFKAGENHRS